MLHYLILAHKNPAQLQLLIDTLYWVNSRIYIHVDAKAWNGDIMNLQNVEYIQKRISIEWWGFTMVQATLYAFHQILSYMSEWDHLVMMSWQDFPIKSQDFMYSFFAKYSWKSFMEYRIQPNEEWNILNRVIKYHFHDLRIPEWIDNLIRVVLKPFYPVHILRNQAFWYILAKIVNIIFPEKTYLIRNYKIYWGSSWQILAFNHIQYILKFLDSKKWKRFINEFHSVAWPDELFFQCILLNSIHKDDIINNLQWYIDWKKWPGLPRILDETDFEDIMWSWKIFARKFDFETSSKLLHSIK